jgi:non-specific serine/threonine protein kinase
MQVHIQAHELHGDSHNLPRHLTSFVGRDEEIAGVNKLFHTTRSITLIGTGGVGKTRLCLEFAINVLKEYQHGIWFVELDYLREPQLIIDQIYTTIGLQVTEGGPSIEDLCDYLKDKNLLIILDNCEHLVIDCARLAEQLLLNCPNLKLICTSREPLGFPGEILFNVPAMKLPPIGGRLEWEEISKSEAAQLFLERIRSFQPEFQVDEETAQAISQICYQLEGIPLALELAAARVRLLSVPQIASRLENSLRLLTKGSRIAQPRQQTMRKTIEWSYTLLTDKEQTLFRYLAVFSGKFTLEDVEQICSGEISAIDQTPAIAHIDLSITSIVIPQMDVLDLLSNLVDKSLVMVVQDQEYVYRLLIPIRRFAREELSNSGEIEYLRNRHLSHYLALAEEANSKLRSAEQNAWRERLGIEHDNLRAALTWSLESGAIEMGLRLAMAFNEFWFRSSFLKEGVDWFERLLSAQDLSNLTYAKALIIAGSINQEYGDLDQAKSYAQIGLRKCEEFNDLEGIALAHRLLGIIAHFKGDRQKGISHLEKSLMLFRDLGEDWNIASTLLYLGDAHIRSENYDRASILTQECLFLFKELGDRWGIGFSLGCCGELERKMGNHKKAMDYFRESLLLHSDQRNKGDICYLLEDIAITEIEQGNIEKATLLWGAAVSLRDTIHAPLPSSYQVDYAPYLVEARAKLGEEVYESALQVGGSLSLDQVINMALQDKFPNSIRSDVSDADRGESKKALPFNLTEREIDVLCLVAEGYTDAHVAEQLFISPRTVGKHLESIYRKLEVNSRTAAARIAIDQKLI